MVGFFVWLITLGVPPCRPAARASVLFRSGSRDGTSVAQAGLEPAIAGSPSMFRSMVCCLGFPGLGVIRQSFGLAVRLVSLVTPLIHHDL